MSGTASNSDLPRPARHPLAELLLLATPTVVQMASYTILQFIDTLMLAHYGRHYGLGILEPTAAANAGIFGFALISLGMGVLFVVNTLVSQSYGRGTRHECGRYLWQGIWFSIIFSVLVLPFLPFAGAMFRSFGHAPDLARLEATYLHITVGLAVLKLVATAMHQFLLAINRPMLVLYATLAAVGVNLVANWLLIYGHLGLPELGLAGAAWGTKIATLFELGLLVWFIRKPRIGVRYNAGDWRVRRAEMRVLIRVGVPSGFQIVADVLAWALFSVWVMAYFGERGMAANTFMMRYMMISFMPAFGVATAVTALVGRYIGMNRPDLSERRAHLGFVVTAIYMLTCGLLFFFGRHLLIGVFTADPEVIRIGALLLIFAAVYQFFDAVYIVYNGALRGAGDTLVPAIATGVLCWGMVVLGGVAVARYFPQWGVTGPWMVATLYGVVLGVFMFWRFQRGRWREIHLAERVEQQAMLEGDTLSDPPSGGATDPQPTRHP